MTRDIPPNPFKTQLRSAARHLSMALRLLDRESRAMVDLARDSYEGYRARHALASALVCASQALITPYWPRAFADAEAFKVAFRDLNLLRVRARDAEVTSSVIGDATPHLRMLLEATHQAMEDASHG
ncbi:MAG: hypothetical protein ABJF67_02355 [Aurantimonas coralicida]|jgi:hypothetical protein|uniref:hypothetical protein n=1 Tax=Aurantimonadaceae TaxID=255475 RepID=UPI000320A4C1|nr:MULTISPECIES: hypothetical protein [Aurantimonadaceae]MAU97069.1 hypothetical protein [Fulvimarina sp.]MCC4300257.1 hypothetical protein [Aurantimonas coralicida]MCQ0990411.1 hypothetical protein [Jiella sp. LLJ827]MDE0924254.1 hypothetical protein [Aurantimonas coralicida]